jgi:hypothetical protein
VAHRHELVGVMRHVSRCLATGRDTEAFRLLLNVLSAREADRAMYALVATEPPGRDSAGRRSRWRKD